MSSEAKRKKAGNSYLLNGGEKCDFRMKGTMYFTKRERKRLKKDTARMLADVISDRIEKQITYKDGG